MKKIIIAIHGLGNKPPKALLQKWWLTAIKEGWKRSGKMDKDIPLELVYWADIFHHLAMDPKIKDKENPLYLDEPYLSGPPTNDEKKPSIKSKIYTYIENQLDRVFLNEDLSINFSSVTDQFIHHFFSELEAYYSDENTGETNANRQARKEIQNRFLQVITKYKGYDIMLIAHSMGSIIAFDVLTRKLRDFSIDTFVTMGSPLGLPMIVSRVFKDIKKDDFDVERLKVPDCIKQAWFNLSDSEDKVAMDRKLSRDFTSNAFGTGIVDMLVNNDYEWNEEKNPHKSYGYLRSKEMIEIIDEFLSRKSNNWITRQFQSALNKIKITHNSIKSRYSYVSR